MTQKFYFGLIWPHDFLPWLLQMVIGKLKTGLGMCWFKQGKPWRLSVLPTVTLETAVPAHLRSLTSSSRVVLGWFLTFLRIIETPRGEILHGAPVRGRLTVMLSFFHFIMIAPRVDLFFTKLLGNFPVAFFRLVEVFGQLWSWPC